MHEVKRLTTGPEGTDEYSVTIIMERNHQADVFKVAAKYGLSGRSFKRARTFRGEAAWMDADRAFYDWTLAARRIENHR